jgi:hypothetical protein
MFFSYKKCNNGSNCINVNKFTWIYIENNILKWYKFKYNSNLEEIEHNAMGICVLGIERVG